jgi:hypothetical protein
MSARNPVRHGRAYLCPVCLREARKTSKGNIWSHFDALRIDVCPGGGQPFHITVVSDPEFQAVTA